MIKTHKLSSLTIDFSKYIFLMPLLACLAICFYILIHRVSYRRKKRKHTISKNRMTLLKQASEYLSKYKKINQLMTYLANKIMVFNEYSLEANLQYATLLLLLSNFFLLVILLYLISIRAIWYLAVSYIVFTLIIIGIVFVVLVSMTKFKLNSQLPKTCIILRSRFSMTSNILSAIHLSLNDMGKASRKEFRRIYDTLLKNDKEQIEAVFHQIEQTYHNDHLNIILMLVKEAYFKDVDEVIKLKFLEVTQNILNAIEDEKDVLAVTRPYIFLSLIVFGLGMWGIDTFTMAGLGDLGTDFMSSPFLLTLKLALVLLESIYILVLLIFEKVST